MLLKIYKFKGWWWGIVAVCNVNAIYVYNISKGILLMFNNAACGSIYRLQVSKSFSIFWIEHTS